MLSRAPGWVDEGLPSAAAETRRWTPCPAERLACRRAPVRPRANHGAAGQEGPHGPPGSRCSGRADDFAGAPHAQRRPGWHRAARPSNRFLVEVSRVDARPRDADRFADAPHVQRSRGRAGALGRPSLGRSRALLAARLPITHPPKPVSGLAIRESDPRCQKPTAYPGQPMPRPTRRIEHNKNNKAKVKPDLAARGGPRPGRAAELPSFRDRSESGWGRHGRSIAGRRRCRRSRCGTPCRWSVPTSA